MSEALADTVTDAETVAPLAGAVIATAGKVASLVTFALAWFDAEANTLFSAIALAQEAGFDTHVWQLAWGASMHLVRCGRWADNDWSHLAALAAARRLGDAAGGAVTYVVASAARCSCRVDPGREQRGFCSVLHSASS